MCLLAESTCVFVLDRFGREEGMARVTLRLGISQPDCAIFCPRLSPASAPQMGGAPPSLSRAGGACDG